MGTAYLIAIALGMSAPLFPALEAVTKACGDDLSCQADMLVYMQAESGMSESPRPWSWDSKAHVSCGILQEPCAFVRKASLEGQARYWRKLRDWSLTACADLPEEDRLSALGSGSCARGRALARDRHETAQAVLWAISSGLTIAPPRP